jgi:hypothetical protein
LSQSHATAYYLNGTIHLVTDAGNDGMVITFELPGGVSQEDFVRALNFTDLDGALAEYDLVRDTDWEIDPNWDSDDTAPALTCRVHAPADHLMNL